MQETKRKAKQKNHIKMYASDEFLNKVKTKAESEGVSQSTWLLLNAKKGLKQ